MSGAIQQGTPAAVGSSLGTAAADIGKILDRESGTPGPAGRAPAPRRDLAPGVREAAPQAEPEPEEALADTEDETDEVETEAEEDEGEEEATDESEAAEDDAQSEPAYPVKLPDGKVAEVPVSELVRGYQRNADYSRKMMAFADERRAFTAWQEGLRTERAQYAALVPILEEQIRAHAAPPIDWERLRTENPVEYLFQKDQQRDAELRLQGVEAEKMRLAQVTWEEEQVARKELLARSRQAAAELVPAWRDDAAWKKAMAEARAYVVDLGFTDQEIGTLTDPRGALLVWQAAQYAAMVKRGRPVPAPSRAQQAPAPAPGPHPVRRRVSEHTRAKQRLAQTHSTRDAAAVIHGLLQGAR